MQPSQEISSIWPAQFDFKSTWQANADGPYSSTIMLLTPTTKQETQTTPWKFHKDTTVYIAYFLYCQYQHCQVQYYSVCVALRSEDKIVKRAVFMHFAWLRCGAQIEKCHKSRSVPVVYLWTHRFLTLKASMSLRDKTACIASAALLLNLRLHLGSLWWIKPPTLVLCLREWCPIHIGSGARGRSF